VLGVEAVRRDAQQLAFLLLSVDGRQGALMAAKRKGIDQSWVEVRICARLAARKAKDFAQADAIRAELSAKGVELRDAAQGTDWRVLL